jgi:hypothetical protein
VRKVVYTAVTDGYPVHPVIHGREGWDFLCFSETEIVAEGWTVVRFEEVEELWGDDPADGDPAKASRRFKILPHRLLSDYDVSIWIDSSMQFKNAVRLDALCEPFLRGPALLQTRSHPYRRCIYREGEAVVRCGLDSRERVEHVLAAYRREEFPENAGLAETGFLLRKHSAEALIDFSERWWEVVRDGSRRDQLSFNYVLWKYPVAVDFIDDRVPPFYEKLMRGRFRGPFFDSTFHFHPTRGR